MTEDTKPATTPAAATPAAATQTPKETTKTEAPETPVEKVQKAGPPPANVAGQDQPQDLETVVAREHATDDEIDAADEPVRLLALHQVIHDGTQVLPGKEFTAPARTAADLIEAKMAIGVDDRKLADAAFDQAERARARSLREGGRLAPVLPTAENPAGEAQPVG